MIGVALICHGEMANGLKDSVRLVIGEQEQFKALGLYEDDSIDEFANEVYDLIKEVNSNGEVLVLVDVMGASPYNATSRNITKLKEDGINIRVISGVNLPMLLETLLQRPMIESLDELYPLALTSGRDSIKELFEELDL